MSSEKRLKVIDNDLKLKGFFDLRHLQYSHSLYRGGDSPTLVREVFCHGPAVVVLLVDELRKQAVFVEQCRAGAVMNEVINQSLPIDSAWLLEPVAGLVEMNEDPIEAVKRECLEEAGVVPERIEFITRYYPSPGACDEELLLYIGYIDANQVPEYAGLESEDEDIRLVKIPYSELSCALAQNRFRVSTSIIAVQWLLLQQLQKES